MGTESYSQKPMENMKEPLDSAPPFSSSSSSSSLTNELFGSKESAPPPPLTGTFSSIFPPPSTVMGRSSSTSELVGSIERHSVGSHVWKGGNSEHLSKNKEGTSHCPTNKERSSIFVERADPCPLSSSLYYGGLEDMYMRSSNAQSPGSYPQYKKDGVENDENVNDSHCASRGNWWQGSLYY